MRLMIIWGSSRQGRKGGPVAYWVKSQAKQDKRFEKVDFVDLRELNLPFYNEPVDAFSIEKPEDYKTPGAGEWYKRVKAADMFLIVTPEYNHGPSAVLKNALDYVGGPWVDKPLAIVSYGGATSGVHAAHQLQITAIELGLINVSTTVHFHRYGRAFESGEEPSDYSKEKFKKMIDKLVWLHERLSK